MHAAIPQLKSNGGGVILNMASIAGIAGLADRFAYSMSKGAVVAMTYSVAKDYLAYNIRCNCISPARVHTQFVDGFLRRNYPGREREVFEKLEKSQPLAEWQSRRRWPLWPFSFAQMRPHSSRVRTIPLMEVL